MPRARTYTTDDWQTAAEEENSGCLSFYAIPLFSVLLIACLLSVFAFNLPALPVVASAPNTATPFDAVPILSDIPTAAIHTPVLSPIFTQEVQHWGNDIARWAAASSLDPNLVAVIMQIESCGDPRATSRAGAMGLFQVMPFHFHFGENPYNPETNALRGLGYLSRSLAAANGDPRLALAGYNGGIGVLSRGEWTWSAETKRYIYYGAPIYEDARSGTASSPMLEDWYRKYGAGLCRQASERLGLIP